jgi:Flp pilus assembly protein TadG
MRPNTQRRRGNIAVMTAVCLTVVISIVAIALDGGVLMDDSKRVQSAADASAFAAAEDLFLHYQTYTGLDPLGTAKAAATRLAGENGFPSITVNIPPASGYYAGQAGYAEVIITYSQPRYFSSLFGSPSLPVVGRAVARGAWVAPHVGILLLDPTASGSLGMNGGTTMTVAGVPIIIDSNSPTAATAVGGAKAVAPIYDITGVPGTSGSGTAFSGIIQNGQKPTPDPLAYLPEPDPSTMVVQATHATHASGPTTLTVSPGVFTGGIQITGQASLIMAPGIYYMDGGGFAFSGNGSLTATGVMIYNAPQKSTDIISINGNGAIDLSPPTSGIYTGISLFQDRTSTNTVSVTGNGASSISGTFYVAGGTLSVTGNGTSDVIGSQYISYDLSVNGNGAFSVNWGAPDVARTRIITLVE